MTFPNKVDQKKTDTSTYTIIFVKYSKTGKTELHCVGLIHRW